MRRRRRSDPVAVVENYSLHQLDLGKYKISEDFVSQRLSPTGPMNKLFVQNVIASGIKICGAGLTFLMFMFLARNLGAEDYGKFASMFSLASFLAIVSALGQHTRILKRASSLIEQEEFSTLRRLIIEAGLSVAAASAVISFSLYISGEIFTKYGFSRAAQIVIGAIPFILPFAMSEVMSSALRSAGENIHAMFPRDIFWRGVLCLWLVSPKLSSVLEGDALTSMIAVSAVLVVSVFFQICVFASKMPAQFWIRIGPKNPEKFWRGSVWFWFASVVGIMAGHLSVIFVSTILPAAETGAYFAAAKVSQLVQLPVIAVNIVSAPILARQFWQADPSGMQSTCRSVTPFLFGGTLLGAIIVYFTPNMILSFFDPSFTIATSALLILTFGQLLSAVCGPTGTLMLMAGGEKDFVKMIAVSEGIGLALIFAFSPLLGIVGAAVASVVGKIGWSIGSALWCRRKLGVDATLLNLLRSRQ